MADIVSLLEPIVGAGACSEGDAAAEELTHDEALTEPAVAPAAVVRPAGPAQVAAVLSACDSAEVPVTARGSGTGLSGAANPVPGGVVVSFEAMADIVDIDVENHTATVQPGVTLAALDAALADHGLVYPVSPGESTASLGGNVATNAGGMRAIRYGVTRHQVLGVQAALTDGSLIRSGGKFVKATSGYDLTQLITGSEGTLALVTEATLRLHPRLSQAATVLIPFPTLEAVTAAVPRVVASGVGPLILEYIDLMTMAAMTENLDLDLGVPESVRDRALAYLVVVIEQRTEDRLDDDVAEVAELVNDLGALDVYVLPPGAGSRLIEGREKAFWLAKAAGADDIVDVVVPRASVPDYMARVAEIGTETSSWIAGCGHAGDGNVHLSVFQADDDARARVMERILGAGVDLGGAISGEHGIGTAKKSQLAAFEDPAKMALMRRIKTAFDPNNILNPGTIFD